MKPGSKVQPMKPGRYLRGKFEGIQRLFKGHNASKTNTGGHLSYNYAIVMTAASALDRCAKSMDANSLMRPNVVMQIKDLLKRMCNVGLFPHVETTVTSLGNLKVVVLIKVEDASLEHEWRKLEMERWLFYGRQGDFDVDRKCTSLTPAERLVLIDRLLHEKVERGGVEISSFGGFIDKVYPLHDDQFNRKELCTWWSNWKDYFRNNDDRIEAIRCHFGEQTALYFAYMDMYTKWLFPLAVAGVLAYLISFVSFTAYFRACAILGFSISSIWGTLFLIFWKRREKALSMEWGIGVYQYLEYANPNFKGVPTVNPITGATTLSYPTYKRALKYGIGSLLLIVMVSIEVIITIGFVDMYFYFKSGCGGLCPSSGFQNWVLVLSQGVMLGLVVDLFQYQIFRMLAIQLTNWENHSTEKSYEMSRAVKIFVWDFLGIYSWFWVCAFVYIPHGTAATAWIRSLNILPWKSSYVEGTIDLGEIFITPLIATQGLKIIFDKIVPYYLHKGASTAIRAQGGHIYALYLETQTIKKTTKKIVSGVISRTFRRPTLGQTDAQSSSSSDDENDSETSSRTSTDLDSRPVDDFNDALYSNGRESTNIENVDSVLLAKRQAYLKRVLEQSVQTPHDSFADYADTCVQFGYVTQFTCVWPFIPLCGLANNLFELRSSAFQLAYIAARPTPRKTKSIGVWYHCLRFSSIWAVFINLLIICYSSGLLEWFFVECTHPDMVGEFNDRLPPLLPNEKCVSRIERFRAFYFAEHLLLGANFLVIFFFPKTPATLHCQIREEEIEMKFKVALQLKLQETIATKTVKDTRKLNKRYAVQCAQLLEKLDEGKTALNDKFLVRKKKTFKNAANSEAFTVISER